MKGSQSIFSSHYSLIGNQPTRIHVNWKFQVRLKNVCVEYKAWGEAGKAALVKISPVFSTTTECLYPKERQIPAEVLHYLDKAGSRCLRAPPTKCRLPVTSTWISVASRSKAALAIILGFTGSCVLSEFRSSESLPWAIHCRLLRIQGKTKVSAFFSGTRQRVSPMSIWGPTESWQLLVWRRQLLSLSKQRVSI